MADIIIGGTIHSSATGNVAARANEILDSDKGKKQSVINQEVDEALNDLQERTDDLEGAVGTGGSVDSRIAAAVNTEKARAEAKETQLMEIYQALDQSALVVLGENDALPNPGVARTIYRKYGGSSYTDYMYDSSDLTTPIPLATYDNAIDEEPTPNSDNLVKSGGVFDAIDGAISFKEVGTCEDENVLVFVADKDGKVFATINKDGSITKKVLDEREKADKRLLQMVSSDYDGEDDVLKYLTDEEDKCFGYIKKDGTVVLYKAEIKDLKTEGGDDKHSASEAQMATVLGLVATGVDNIEMSNNPKVMSVLNNLFTENIVSINADNRNNKNLRPIISIIDDDTIDNQIPSSKATDVTPKAGGYFSLLLPFTLSLRAKHNKPVPVGLACEGHRVGFTPNYSSDDSYSALNENGLCVKWLHNNIGWNVLNHSMTAQLPIQAYYVDGIESSLANQIKSETANFYSPYSFHNCRVLDRTTGKWYELNNQSRTEWVEMTPTKKYAMPFYKDYLTNKWYFNRDFDFDYSWGEWFKRADELGMPYERVIVHNGGTSSVFMASAGRKYAYFSVRTQGVYNNPPIAATVSRVGTGNMHDYNAWSDRWVNDRLGILDTMEDEKSWVVFMSHFNDQEAHRNYYLSGKDYPGVETDVPIVTPELRTRDDNYPEEWIVPLKHEEIQDIIGANVHDYINHPPSRLGISSWDEWHPCPATQLAAFYYILDEAMSRGIDIVTPWDGWQTHGNILNIGVDRGDQSFSYDSASKQTPYTDEEKSFLTIGADMSIRYYNSKSNN